MLKAQVDAYGHVFLVASIVVFIGAFTILSLKVKEKMDAKVLVE